VVLSLGLSDLSGLRAGSLSVMVDLLPRLGVNSARQLGDAANAGESSATISI
jgi:cell division inhibitor SulA